MNAGTPYSRFLLNRVTLPTPDVVVASAAGHAGGMFLRFKKADMSDITPEGVGDLAGDDLGIVGVIIAVLAAVFIAENDFFTGRCIDIDGGLRL